MPISHANLNSRNIIKSEMLLIRFLSKRSTVILLPSSNTRRKGLQFSCLFQLKFFTLLIEKLFTAEGLWISLIIDFIKFILSLKAYLCFLHSLLKYECQLIHTFLKIFEFLDLKNFQFLQLRRQASSVLIQLRRESGQTGQLGALVSAAKKPEAVLVF